MLNTNNNFKALSLSTESEVLNSLKLNTCSNEKGRSMIEMLGVLAIIGVLSVGGIAGYSKAMLKYKTNKTIDQVTMLVTNIRTLYAQQDNFTGLGEASAVNMGVVPDEMIDSVTGDAGSYSAATLLNPFSGKVTITPVYSVPGAAGQDGAFIIGINGIPKEACMAMVVSDWGSNYSSGLIGMALSNEYNAEGLKDSTNMAAQKTAKAASGYLDTGNAAADHAKVYAGGACVGEAVPASSAKYGSYCAKNLPIAVAEASRGCACTGSTCSVAIKYY